MPLYRYTATATGGSAERGELAADSAYQVRLALRKQGLRPVKIREAARRERGKASSKRRKALEHFFRDRRRARLAELYENLAALVATGTPLVAALELLANEQSREAAQTASLCRGLAERVRRGESFEAAATARGDWFSPIDTALIRAAERGGELDTALADLAGIHARSDAVRSTLAMALAYPALLLVFGTGVVIFLTTSTLPQIAAVLNDAGGDAGAELPAATEALLFLGTTLKTKWPIALVLGGVFIAFLTWVVTSKQTARLRLKAPLVGPLLRRAHTGSMSLLLARLLRGGVPLADALALVTPTVGNAALREAIGALRTSIEKGADAPEALRSSGLFDAVFVRVVEVGQASGELPDALETIGTRMRSSAARLTDRLAAIAEPAAILILAAAIGFVVYAALAPMLQLTQAL